MRKPRSLRCKPRRGSYAGISETSYEHSVYIGGDYYGDSAQIHLFKDEVRRLGEWLIKAADYLEEKPAAERKE